MFDFSTLITDRTDADVSYLSTLMARGIDAWTEEELKQFNAGMLKGGYWWTDLNRVTACMEYLNSTLLEYGYSSGYVSTGKVWTKEDNQTETEMAQYVANIKAIRNAFDGLRDVPEAPTSMKKMTTATANSIEQIMVVVEQAIQQIIKSMVRSNSFAFWSGNRPFPTAESYKGRTWNEFDAMGFVWNDMENSDWYLWAYGDPRKV